MNNSYNQIAHQFLNKDKSSQFNVFMQEIDLEDSKYLTKEFISAFRSLAESHPAIFILFGDANFKKLVFFYVQYFLLSEENAAKYGKQFGGFIQALPSLANMNYLKWIAKLDWFWTHQDQQYILLPKGTLESWGSVYKDSEEINILIDENFMEKLTIQRSGNEVSIVKI